MKRFSQLIMVGTLAVLVVGCSSHPRQHPSGMSARADDRGNYTARPADHQARQEPTMGTHTDADGRPAVRDERMASRDVAGAATAGSENSPTATAVRERLVQEGTVESSRVRVQDDRGTIYLSGTVDSPSQKQRAEQVATGT